MKGVDEVGAWVVIDGVVKWDGEVLKGSRSVKGFSKSGGFEDLVQGFGG